MKKLGKSTKKEAHAPKTQYGSGDYYGVGVKQKVGRIRSVYPVDGQPAKNTKTPPKSLA